MPNQRTYTDDQLRTAVTHASCWADVMETLGKSRTGNPAWPRKRALQLGLDTTKIDGYPGSMILARKQAIPFVERSGPNSLGRLGLSAAISWFLGHGYNPSIPVEPCLYDLVVESDQGLQRIQVKTTRTKTAEGHYRAGIGRGSYDPEAVANARGRFRAQPYDDGTVDFFFIVCDDGRKYMIPQPIVSGLKEIALTRKYAAFEV